MGSEVNMFASEHRNSYHVQQQLS